MDEPRAEPTATGGHMQGEPAADRDLRNNFVVLLVHGMLGQTGFRLLQAPTFLPSYLRLLAGNNSVVGIAAALQSLGMSLSPYVGAWMVEHRRRVKKLGLVFGGVMRFQVLLLALSALLLPQRWAMLAVWIVLGLWGFASGLQGVIFNFMISKTIPAHRRGRLLGLRNATAGVTLLMVSAIGGWLLERFGFPLGYGWTFLLAFLLTALGLVAFAFMREPDSTHRRPRARFVSRLGDLPTLLRSDPSYSRFVVARLFATAARGALPYYVLSVDDRFGISGTRLAILTIVFTVAQSSGALFWGFLSDRTGFRFVFLGGVLVWMAGNALTLVGDTVVSSYAVFFLVGTGFSGLMLASQNLVLEFGDERERPMRIAATNSSAELVGMLGFLGAGLLSDHASLQWIFSISVLFQSLAVVQMWRVVDPRLLAQS